MKSRITLNGLKAVIRYGKELKKDDATYKNICKFLKTNKYAKRYLPRIKETKEIDFDAVLSGSPEMDTILEKLLQKLNRKIVKKETPVTIPYTVKYPNAYIDMKPLFGLTYKEFEAIEDFSFRPAVYDSPYLKSKPIALFFRYPKIDKRQEHKFFYDLETDTYLLYLT